MINLETLLLNNTPTHEEGGRYLRTLYGNNTPRFRERFLKPVYRWLKMNGLPNADEVINFYDELFKISEPYSYKEAFKISDNNFRAKVFSAIDVPTMVKHLGHNRVETGGVDLVNRVYDTYSKEFKDVPFTQIYELHSVNGKDLGITGELYAIKCWCTSTNNEHWLFTDASDTKDPIELIARTCVVYKKMLGKIKHIIRQGDIYLFEMNEYVEIKEDDETIPLTKDLYLSLLKSQS